MLHFINSLVTVGYKAIDTIRKHRMNGCSMKSVVEMKKVELGSYDYRSFMEM